VFIIVVGLFSLLEVVFGLLAFDFLVPQPLDVSEGEFGLELRLHFLC